MNYNIVEFNIGDTFKSIGGKTYQISDVSGFKPVIISYYDTINFKNVLKVNRSDLVNALNNGGCIDYQKAISTLKSIKYNKGDFIRLKEFSPNMKPSPDFTGIIVDTYNSGSSVSIEVSSGHIVILVTSSIDFTTRTKYTYHSGQTFKINTKYLKLINNENNNENNKNNTSNEVRETSTIISRCGESNAISSNPRRLVASKGRLIGNSKSNNIKQTRIRTIKISGNVISN